MELVNFNLERHLTSERSMTEKQTNELKDVLTKAPKDVVIAGRNILNDLVDRTTGPTNHGQTSHVQTGHGQSPHNKSFNKS